MMSKLRRSLVLHEDLVNHPYKDTLGNVTAGVGYNITARGLPEKWINSKITIPDDLIYAQLQDDITYFYDQLSSFDWYQQLTPDRQIVLIDMAFMGWKKFLTFDKMINAISIGDYNQAAFEMLNSEWAEQVKQRATDLAQGMLTGSYNV